MCCYQINFYAFSYYNLSSLLQPNSPYLLVIKVSGCFDINCFTAFIPSFNVLSKYSRRVLIHGARGERGTREVLVGVGGEGKARVLVSAGRHQRYHCLHKHRTSG